MSINQRLQSLISHLQETPASFSEKLGIQRSSLSHILSSRNKPSVDFFEKLLQVFPLVNLSWLIAGTGKMIIQTIKSSTETEIPDDAHENRPTGMNQPSNFHVFDNQPGISKEPIKIVWFYQDGTCEVFNTV